MMKRSRHKRIIFILVAFLLALAAGLVIAEIGLRTLGEWVGVYKIAVFAIPLDGNPHRRSDVPGLLWELAPNVDTFFQNGRVKTNSRGFRDRDYGPKGDAVRILSLGDSIAFGASVEQEDTYAKMLERLLNDGAGKTVEVINAGVSGYNFLQYAITYQQKARQYDPDLILLSLFDDDFLPPYIPMEHRFQLTLLRHSLLYRTLADRLEWLHPIHGAGQSTRISRFYDHSVSRLKKMQRQARQEGRSLLALFHPDLQPGMDASRYRCTFCDLLDETGIPYIEMFPVYAQTGRPLVSFSIQPTGDPHPNAQGHRLIAETIRDYLLAHPELLGGG